MCVLALALVVACEESIESFPDELSRGCEKPILGSRHTVTTAKDRPTARGLSREADRDPPRRSQTPVCTRELQQTSATTPLLTSKERPRALFKHTDERTATRLEGALFGSNNASRAQTSAELQTSTRVFVPPPGRALEFAPTQRARVCVCECDCARGER